MNWAKFQKSIGMRVEIEPPACFLDENEKELRQGRQDWIVQSFPQADVVVIQNDATSHMAELGKDHIYDYRSNRTRSKGELRFGFLVLKMQIFVQGNRLWLRPNHMPGASVRLNGGSELGEWHGKRFVYHEPQRVLTVHVTAADNEKLHVFEVYGPQAGALVELRVVIDAVHGRVQAMLDFAHGKSPFNWAGWHPNIRQSLRLPENRLLALRTSALPDTDLTTIRVFVVSWQL